MVPKNQSAKIAFLSGCFVWIFAVVSIGSSFAAMGELEKFIRARIEIGEGMFEFMKQQGGKQPTMEEIEAWEKEINAMVAEILDGYGLTIEEYNNRSKEVFSDKEAVNAFLEKHPDLKERYNVLPMHRGMGGGRSPH